MSQILFSNNANSTLLAPITSVATTVTLAPGTGSLFPNLGAGQYFVASLLDVATRSVREIVWVTGVSGDTLTIVRGEESTAPRAWSAGDIIANNWTAGQAAAMQQIGSSSGWQGEVITTNHATLNQSKNFHYINIASTGAAPTENLPTTPNDYEYHVVKLIGGGAGTVISGGAHSFETTGTTYTFPSNNMSVTFTWSATLSLWTLS